MYIGKPENWYKTRSVLSVSERSFALLGIEIVQPDLILR